MRCFWALTALAATILLTACGGGDGSYEALVFGTAEGIVERPLDGGERRVLVPVSDSTHTLRDPAVSPDGSRLVYVDAPPLRRVEGALDASADLWLANGDGSEPRILYEHAQVSESVSTPQWLDDRTVLFQVRAANDAADASAGNTYQLMRIDVDAEGGAPSAVMEGVIAFDISDDGARIAYIKIESAAEQPLFIANIDGSGEVRRLDTAGSGLAGFSAVAFTGDSAAVWLIAHEEQTSTPIGGARPLAAMLHTAPLDLYRVTVADGAPELFAPLQIDGGNITLGDDGDLYLLAGDLLHVDPDTGETATLEEPDRYGGIGWRKG